MSMESFDDPLQPVPWSRMMELSEKLLSRAPESLMVHGSIQIALRWKGTNASQRIVVYATNNHVEEGGIVGIYKGANFNEYKITLYCFSENITALRNALLTTNRINWNSPKTTIRLCAIPEKLMPLAVDCLFHHNFELQWKANTIYKSRTPDQPKIISPTCRSEVRLAPLSIESVKLIKSHWYGDVPDSEEYITTLITHNPSLGVYSIKTGELCAWVTLSEFCTLGMLHTVERHRRKGYARLLCHSMSEQLLQTGNIVGATVDDYNTASLRMFDSLEFKTSPNFFVYGFGTPSKK